MWTGKRYSGNRKMKKKIEPNYEILFKSAVWGLQHNYKELMRVKREKFIIETSGFYDNDGVFCIIDAESKLEELAKQEHYLAEQVANDYEEVNRLRRLKNATEDND